MAESPRVIDDELLRHMELAADKYDRLAMVMGRFALTWGGAEQALDVCVAIIWRALGGRVFERRLPKQLERKVDFLERCFQEMPELRRLRARGLRVVAKVRKLAAMRHDLIHGALKDSFGRGERFYFQKFDFANGEIHVVRTFPFDLWRAPALEEKVVALHAATHDLMYEVLTIWAQPSTPRFQIMRAAPGEKPPRPPPPKKRRSRFRKYSQVSNEILLKTRVSRRKKQRV